VGYISFLLLARAPVRLSSLAGFVIKPEAFLRCRGFARTLGPLGSIQGFVSPSLEFGSYTLRGRYQGRWS
jgi:hypothetical protein